MKRKVVAAALAVMLVGASLAGCGGSSSDSSSDSSSADTEESTDEASDESSDTEESTDESSDESESSDTEESSEDADTSSDESSSSESSSSGGSSDDMLAGTEFEGLSADDAYSFQIIVKAYSSTYWQALIGGVNDACDDFGVTADNQGPNNESDVADQVNMLNTAINNAPDGVGIAACDADSCTDSLNTAMSDGVPIVAFDSGFPDAPEGSVVATVSTDNYAAGGIAGDAMWDAIKDVVTSSDSQMRVGYVGQDSVSASHQGRGTGFIDYLIDAATADGVSVAVTGNDYFVNACKDAGDESTADLVIEVRIPSQATADLCQTEATALMNKNDLVGIYASGQMSSEAIIAADSNLGVLSTDASSGIIGIGFDSGTILKEAVSSGTLYGAITQAPYGMGYYTVCALIANANGQDVEDMSVAAYLYTADNMDDPEIAQNLYD